MYKENKMQTETQKCSNPDCKCDPCTCTDCTEYCKCTQEDNT